MSYQMNAYQMLIFLALSKPNNLPQKTQVTALMDKNNSTPTNGFSFSWVWQCADEATQQQVLAFWQKEKAINNIEAAKARLAELAAIAKDCHGNIVGVSTAYPEFCSQLGCKLYYVRAFASQQLRQQNIATSLICVVRDAFEKLSLEATLPACSGIFMEVENPFLKTHVNVGYHQATKMTFVGKNAKQDHLYVYYFPGAKIS